MNPAPAAARENIAPQLLERRARLQAAAASVSPAYLNDLLAEIDAALQRIDSGTFGICESCHDTIEADRLQVNPLVRFCLDHLSGTEMRAHQQDLDLAAEIQAKLLPPSVISLDCWETHYRYQPVGAVGGDYCELAVSRDRNSLFFAVGDVAGKGVAASLLMTHLSAILRSLLSLNLPLAEVTARANRLFCESTLTSHYATLVCGRASAEGVELCNAGHCPPFLLRPNATERLDASGLPLGLFCSVEYPVTRVDLAAGDCLALYTDGITEAQDPDGNLFGEDRLTQSLRHHCGRNAETLAQGVIDDAGRFRGGSRPTDDLTLLILRRHTAKTTTG
jgi:sigma-B regulation protein RsbU (phosphoserine phosphatase)